MPQHFASGEVPAVSTSLANEQLPHEQRHRPTVVRDDLNGHGNGDSGFAWLWNISQPLPAGEQLAAKERRVAALSTGTP
jgi:hypothetical protein